MAENQKKDLVGKQGSTDLLEQLEAEETLEITLRKSSNEIVLKNPADGRIIKLKANIEDGFEEQLENLDEDDIPPPLTPDQFESGLRRLDKLDLKFSVDLMPLILAKDESSPDLIGVNEFEELQAEYPNLPREVGLVVHNTLTGRKDALDILGGLENFLKKSALVKELVITNEYKSEFFFKHALKVPYFESIDWEVVVKTHEKGVEGIVSIPYALLMLTLHDTNHRSSSKSLLHQNITVAVNLDLIAKLLGTLTKVKAALEESEKLRELIANRKA